jgi:Zn finger protein HypA/HybF involved in hydrogenase expression
MEDPADTSFALVVCRSCQNIVGDVGQTKCPLCGSSPFRITSYQAGSQVDSLQSVRPRGLSAKQLQARRG